MDNIGLPRWFRILAVSLLIWNIIGIITLIGQVNLTKDALAMMTPPERQFYIDMPVWVVSAFALNVFGGFVGCLTLLAKRKWARSFLIASLIGVSVQIAYYWVKGNGLQVFSGRAILLPAFILSVAILSVWLAQLGIRKGWLR